MQELHVLLPYMILLVVCTPWPYSRTYTVNIQQYKITCGSFGALLFYLESLDEFDELFRLRYRVDGPPGVVRILRRDFLLVILGHFVIQYAYHALYVIRNNIRAEVFGVVYLVGSCAVGATLSKLTYVFIFF